MPAFSPAATLLPTPSFPLWTLVEAGLGIGINNQVNSSLWQDRVVHLPLKPAQTMNIGLAYGKNISPASEGFLHFIEDKLPE